MRNGSGKIYIKIPIVRQSDGCLNEITNNIHTKSQVSSQKAQKLTQLDSSSSKHSSRAQHPQNLQLIYLDANKDEGQQLSDDPSSIVRKLSNLNTIFKQLKMLKQSGISYQVLRSLSKIQDKFIGIERQILKTARLDSNN